MSVLLVSPPSFSPSERFYIPCNEIPLSLCYLSAYIGQRGFDSEILDLDVQERGFSFTEYISRTRPSIVGFTSFSPYIENAHSLAAEVKRILPGAVTLIGGYHASAFCTEALQEFPSFDILVFGEGEQTLLELCTHFLKNGGGDPSHITGISFRRDGKIICGQPRAQFEDIDAIPFPAREKLQLNRYVPNPVNYMKLPTTAMLASRGCRFGCTFCSKFLFKGERVRSADNILEEVRQCGAQFGIRDFRFYDDNFTYHRANCMKFCELAPSRAPGISWNCFSRVDCIDEELLRAMKSAGCYQVKYGVETGSEETLAAINKRITFDQSRAAIALSKRLGVECQISMMIGLPGETPADIDKTIRFAIELSPDLILFNVFKPIPGSVIYNKLKKENNLLDVRWEDYLVKSPKQVVRGGMSAAELAAALKKAYFSFYIRGGYIMQRLKWLARAPRRELRRYSTAAKIFAATVSKKT